MEIEFKLRVDGYQEDIIPVMNKIDKWSIVQEDPDGENPHCHCYLKTVLKRDTMVKRIKQLKNYVKGNGFYSLRELIPDDDKNLKYHAYMCKESKPTYHGFTSDEIEEIKAYQSKVKEQIKEKKAKKRTILQQMEDKFNYKRGEVFTDQVVEDVINFYEEQGTLVREFAMISQVQTLLLKYDPTYKMTLSVNIHKALDKSKI